MSLLSNLLAFSSLNHPTQRQQRASSASGRFLFEEQPQKTNQSKQRIASKSLSKMGLLSNSATDKVDKKSLKLHKFASKISRKIRKHYYEFFVTLETMKKNNQSVKRKPLIDMDKLQMGIAKATQTFSIRYLKQYENSYKTECFYKIKNYGEKAHLAKILQRICINSDYKTYSLKLLNYLKSLQKLQMKVELIQGAFLQIKRKCDKFVLQKSFDYLKQTQRKEANTEKKEVSVFQMFDNLQKKLNNSPPRDQIDNLSAIKMTQKTSNFTDSMEIDQSASKLLSNNSTTQPSQSFRMEQSKHHNYFNSLQFLTEIKPNLSFSSELKQRKNQNFQNSSNQNQSFDTPYQNRTHFIQSSPIRNFSSRSKSPFKVSKKVNNLKQSVQVDSLQLKNYPKIYKSYKVICNYTEEPYQTVPKSESIPKVMNKICIQQFAVHQVEDLADKSNIFRDFKGSKVSEIDMLEISNVVAEPFQRAQTLISDIEKNRQKCQSNNQRSQLSYIPYLPHEGSISSINHRDREESSFGCDAVNFKNSLVLQRQSMKKPQRQKIDMFIKKKTFVTSNEMVDSQSQQISNTKSKRYKNEISDRKMQQHPSMYNSYESNYGFQSDYLKRDMNTYQIPRSTTPVMHSVYPSFNWEAKKVQNQFNSEGKNKSYSFNSSSSDAISRRSRFNHTGADLERKNEEQQYIPSLSFSTNNIKDHQSWKNQSAANQRQMPVRDVGMEPISKLRMKNGGSHHQNPVNKEPQYAQPKKFISINKR